MTMLGEEGTSVLQEDTTAIHSGTNSNLFLSLKTNPSIMTFHLEA